ncbi:ankyrin repeat domain-containing protein 49 [Callorhinchus milii]|uniref:Ankyrin repeat domain 49 n=1 Tax=Callorhinchus milii TaxID=7868 RepID=V9L4T2_CALMI|nr:ankyrin repeat domain-containing protein 49 [Callorhinchus milii]XP_007900274.1 ankyrin repeat domain-containing protein 49 [Callorhinchus milii]XP_042189908.1 ankyrin repeat domain-containing protein 49 [Callorhinchus milii]XP_042189910.1 ankyrin repeat domain-containing protein 49 [Callorhinchus milii]|eukprot:gi/632937590/ref/XP_007900256.1/ PREDICTED: ankyrin repeat domain-containing protein 49 [Callorhinchus milii]
MSFVTHSEENNPTFPKVIESPEGRTELMQDLPDYFNQLELLETHRHLIPMGTQNMWPGESDEEEDETENEECLKSKEKELENDPANLLLWASEKNRIPILRRLLSEHPTLVNIKDEDQYTPLHRAAYSGHLEAARELISHEADITARTVDGWTPLHSACNWSNTEVASFLLQHGADINAQTNGMQTSLHLASGNKATKATIELLLMNRYINPNLRNNLGETPYDVARRTNPYYYLFEITENCTNSVLDS